MILEQKGEFFYSRLVKKVQEAKTAPKKSAVSVERKEVAEANP